MNPSESAVRLQAAPGTRALVHVPSGPVRLEGMLVLPPATRSIVLFAHGSGSSRLSPRNGFVAEVLHRHGIGSLLIDLLTRDEDGDFAARFDIELLTGRLLDATRWLRGEPRTAALALGYFGASTGAAAALQAAARLGHRIGAVVSRGGRPDLAHAQALAQVVAPTLLIVGGDDRAVIDLNRQAYRRLDCVKEIRIVSGASHLFEEAGTLEQAAQLAASWFQCYLDPPRADGGSESR